MADGFELQSEPDQYPDSSNDRVIPARPNPPPANPPHPNPPRRPTPQESFFANSATVTEIPDSRGPKAEERQLNPYVRDARSKEVVEDTSELEQKAREDQRQIEQLEAQIASTRKEHCRLNERLRNCARMLTDQERQLEAAKRQQFPRLARLEMRKSAELAQGVSDYLLAKTLIPALRTGPAPVIFLASGNPYQEIDEEGEKQLATFFKHLSRKAFVLFDADSKAAPAIVRLSEGQGVLGISGIVGKTLEGARVAVITNPFLRMETVLAADSITFSPDSVLGLGLQFEAVDKTFFVLPMGKKWESGLSKWSAMLGSYGPYSYSGVKNLGISYKQDKQPRVMLLEDRNDDLNRNGNDRRWNPLPEIEVDQLVRVVQPQLFQDAFEYSKGFLERKARLAAHLKSIGVIETVAFFGSGEGGAEFEDNVVDSVRRVSVALPIVTGGAGGYMRTANREASKRPGFSIGVPMGGRKNWHEETSLDSLHLTIPAVGYEQRIPLIFDQETASYILVAPGGMGTMKELATAFTALSPGNQTTSPQIVFIGSKYYGPLVEWIKELPLPVEISGRIIIR